ncbi:MAG TPA: cupredoxin domain-containing protein [Patescibacteria group bacterium]|nr:cupredoxin domain-containing protein [Patescibacteria group bacterium]
MGKSTIVLLVALTGLILIGGYFLTRPVQAPEAQPVSQPSPATNTIAYTDTGFSPKSITVKPGTTVTFVNESSTDMWVASALHPTHLELPGFDQLQGEPKGATYSFTFEDIGTWSFHDHLNPTTFGSVIVAE